MAYNLPLKENDNEKSILAATRRWENKSTK